MFTIYGHSGHLGHMANIIFPWKACVQNLNKNGPAVSEKSKFYFLCVHYENTPMQHTAFFAAVKMTIFG